MADPPARVWSATHLAVDAAAPVHAGADGEAVELEAPLAFVIRPAASSRWELFETIIPGRPPLLAAVGLGPA